MAAVLAAGLPAGRVPAGAPRLRAVAAPDRGRGGAPVPDLRARAADPRRRARHADGRGARRPDRRAAAADDAADDLPAPQLPPPLRRAGRDREHGVAARGGERRRCSASCAVAIAFADLVGFVRFTEEEGEQEALDLLERFVVSVEDSLPAQRARGQEHRRRRDDRRHRPGRADGLGDRLPGGVRAALAPADRHPLRAHAVPRRRLLRRATSTSPRASSRARTPARCS